MNGTVEVPGHITIMEDNKDVFAFSYVVDRPTRIYRASIKAMLPAGLFITSIVFLASKFISGSLLFLGLSASSAMLLVLAVQDSCTTTMRIDYRKDQLSYVDRFRFGKKPRTFVHAISDLIKINMEFKRKQMSDLSLQFTDWTTHHIWHGDDVGTMFALDALLREKLQVPGPRATGAGQAFMKLPDTVAVMADDEETFGFTYKPGDEERTFLGYFILNLFGRETRRDTRVRERYPIVLPRRVRAPDLVQGRAHGENGHCPLSAAHARSRKALELIPAVLGIGDEHASFSHALLGPDQRQARG